MENQELKKMVTLVISERDALVVKAILEQQLINNGMTTYMAVAQQLQEQIPGLQPPQNQESKSEVTKAVDKKKK